jgi:hypothetical protein
MYKIFMRITAPTKAEAIVRDKAVKKKLVLYLVSFIFYEVLVNALKAYIFRRPNRNPSNKFTPVQIAFLVVEACRCFWNFTLAYMSVKLTKYYLYRVRNLISVSHQNWIRFYLYFVLVVYSIGTIYSCCILPVYFVFFLINQNDESDELRAGDTLNPIFTSLFAEIDFTSLLAMAYCLTALRSDVKSASEKKRGGRKKERSNRRRYNSMESRRTLKSLKHSDGKN